MATVKLATLLVRTLAKPIANRLKSQAAQHDTFKNLCIDFAQMIHRSEIKLRTYILGEPTKHIRPLSEVRAVENGANMLAEGFLFAVAASLILGETWRSSRSESKRREGVNDQLDDLGTRLVELSTRVDNISESMESQMHIQEERNEELKSLLGRVQICLQKATVDDTPLKILHQSPGSNTPPATSDTHSSLRA